MEIEMICKYCNNEVNNSSALWLKCIECECYIHIKCLKRLTTPGGISGDVFFIFTCAECSVNHSELYVRDKMSWFKVIILVLYHLQYISSGTAKQGFFHWKVHIATFIDKKWQILFPKDFKRKKNWMGTVSGSLSHFSPYFLSSGAKILGETGWWRLTYPKLTPLLTVQIYTELISNKKLHFKNIDFESVKQLIIKYAPSMIKKSNDDVETEMRMEEEIENHPLLRNTDDVDVTGDEFHFLGMDHCCLLQHDLQLNPVFYQSTDLFSDMSAIQEVSPDEIPPEPPTLFSTTTTSDFYQFWDTLSSSSSYSARAQQQHNNNVHLLRANEEKALLDHIVRLPDSGKLRALRRKLIVRQTKRNRGLKLFNIDELMCSSVKREKNDRFSHYKKKNILRKCEEEIRLASGLTEFTDYVVSPYTKRLLKPYIRRNSQPTSHWLTLLNQLKVQVTGQQLQIATLDYCYVRPNYIPAINQLCHEYFWPGIDMSETLEYPDFSCVVLYRKLIVAFAFMVPDVKFNETYISFIFTRPEWRGSGIATFMIYHLINTCMGKDVTLHVAIDNPAICLYQKFGFKVEEVVLNFYDAYLREDCKKCRHAFFLRLAR